MFEVQYNPTHAPAGAPGSTGGQFAKKSGEANAPREKKRAVAARVPRTRLGRHFMKDTRLNAALAHLEGVKKLHAQGGVPASEVARVTMLAEAAREEAWKRAELLRDIKKNPKVALQKALDEADLARAAYMDAIVADKDTLADQLAKQHAVLAERAKFVALAVKDLNAKEAKKAAKEAKARAAQQLAGAAANARAAAAFMRANPPKPAAALVSGMAATSNKTQSWPDPIDIAAEEESLRSQAVIYDHKMAGGGVVGGKRVLSLADGNKALFKPQSGEWGGYQGVINVGQQTEREMAAWEIGKIVGMTDMTAPAVPRTHNGEQGVLIKWAPGVRAEQARDRFDGETDLGRAAAFDWVIGNVDRHAHNWMVDEKRGPSKIHLIDHGLSLPEGPAGGRSAFWNEAERRNVDVGKAAAPFVQNKDRILEALRQLKLPAPAIARVASRIDQLGKATRWATLTRGGI